MFSRVSTVPLTVVDTSGFTGVNIWPIMTKIEAADLFGGTQSALARALDMTRGGISQWPEDLTEAQTDRVLGAAIRLGRDIPPRLMSHDRPSEAAA